MEQPRFIDLFCGVGGFRIAAETFGWRCVFSSDIDAEARKAYQANFGDEPKGDIREVTAESIPDHEALFAGFPCQPFSIIGRMNGLEDARGTLFFEIARILEQKKPSWFVLENVKQLVGNNKGRTLQSILEITSNLGYRVDWRVLNALDFGLPQKRERVFIVGNRRNLSFPWPAGGAPIIPLSDILEDKVAPKFYVSDVIRQKRFAAHQSPYSPGIWHENKARHISSYPFSCALRANASYNYLLVDGVRRLTPREMFRLQGFPDWFQLVCHDSQSRKQAGNAVAVPVVKTIISQIISSMSKEMSFERSAHSEKATGYATLPIEPISA